MSASVDWPTKVVSILQADLTSLGSGKYGLDVNDLRLELKALEDDEAGIVWDDITLHNTEVTLSGVTYSRFIEFINGYTLNFEDTGSPWAIVCSGANHNILDVKTVDHVSLLVGNSAGLQTVTSGSGVLPADITDIATAVWDFLIADATTSGSTGKALNLIKLLALSKA